MDDEDAELRRVEERITVLSNWLIQGRCGDDAECVAAKTAELRALQARRDELRRDGREAFVGLAEPTAASSGPEADAR